MSAPKSNVDVFGSYLSRVGAAPKEASSGSGDAGAEISVLRMLKDEKAAVLVKTLMAHLDLPPSRLMQTLAILREAKLVEMNVTGDDERVELTGLGRSLAE